MRRIITLFFLLVTINTLFAQYTWTAKNVFPDSARNGAACFVINGMGYFVGGLTSQSSFTYTKQTWQYDPVNDTWTRKADFPILVADGDGFSINGMGYVVGGSIPGNDIYTSNLYSYDPGTDNWTQLASFPEVGLGGTEASVIDTIAYVVAGIRNANVHGVSSGYAYNAATNSWASIASYPGTPAIGVSCFAIDSLLYVGGGGNGAGNFYNNFYCYNPHTDQWSQVAALPGKGRYLDGSRFVLNGQGYVAGGGTAVTGTQNFYSLNDTYRYNPSSNSWQQMPGIPNIGRSGASIVSLNGSAYLLGGYNNDQGIFLNDVWEFTSCPVDTEVIFRTVIDTMRITYLDTVRNTVADTSDNFSSTLGTMYINVSVNGGSNTLQVFADSTGSHIYINTGDYAAMAGYAIKISNAQSADVFVSQIDQQQFYIDLNTWTGTGTYVLYIIDPQLQVVATRKIILE